MTRFKVECTSGQSLNSPHVKEENIFQEPFSCQALWYVTSELTTHKGDKFPRLDSFPNAKGFISTEKGNCLHSSSHFKKVITSFVYLMVLNTFTSISPFELNYFYFLTCEFCHCVELLSVSNGGIFSQVPCDVYLRVYLPDLIILSKSLISF